MYVSTVDTCSAWACVHVPCATFRLNPQILVRGPNGALTVGEENDPFQNRAVITLTGRRGEPDLALARTMNLGSKALGIFSNVRTCLLLTSVVRDLVCVCVHYSAVHL